MNQPRTCWSVLLNKAQVEVARIQSELSALRERLEALQVSRKRLVLLHSDYARPPEAGTVSSGMHETLNRRQFANQLLTLIDRIDADMAQLEQVAAHARGRLLSAERERLKMKSLQAYDEKQVRDEQVQRERRQLDEIGTLRHHHGTGL